LIALRQLLALSIVIAAANSGTAQTAPSTEGTFVLHKFAKAIGKETYSLAKTGDQYTLTSDFLFTDRGSPVPLKTSFTAAVADMAPISYTTKGRVSRPAKIDETLSVQGHTITLNRTKGEQTKTTTFAPTGPWFITDGYSPVAMQEQMMRWWSTHNQPAEFTVYPAATLVHIAPAETLTVEGHLAHGYTVSGLIWGQETLWMDDSANLVALVSTDAEFDHFEAVREPYAAHLDTFISAAVKANLKELGRLSAVARMPAPHRLAIVGATLEDSTGATIKDSVILIEDGVIAATGPRSTIKIPKDAKVLDAKGKFAIPGLWDMHAHYEQVEWGPIYLAAGVTSVRDVGNEFSFIKTVHDELDRKQNPAVGPHLEFAGIIDGTGRLSLGAIIADTPEQAEVWVQKYKDAGATQIKIYSSVKPEIVRAITTAAHKRGMTVTGHIPEGMTALQGIDAGMDQINHISYDLPYFIKPILGPDGKPDRTKVPPFSATSDSAKDFIKALQAHHTVLDPTFALYETDFPTRPFAQIEPGIDHVAPQLREALEPPTITDPKAVERAKGLWSNFVGTLRALHAAGIPIVAGTDQAIPGYSLHRELELYVDAGFTPLEALQAATIQAARAAGVEKESGSLTPGKRGDVLLLDADPLADIHNTRAVWRTVAAGAVYTPAPLWQSVGFKP